MSVVLTNLSDIKGYEDIYKASREGFIYRVLYLKDGSVFYRKLKDIIYNKGYYRVKLCKNGEILRFLTHRIIAQTFIQNTNNKHEVNHINGIKTDNRVENLEWVTPSENMKHAHIIGLAKVLRGSKNGNSKLKESDIIEIKNNILNLTQRNLALKYNIDQSQISRIKNSLVWR